MEKENAAEKQKPHGVMWGKTKETTVLDYTMSYSRYANFASKLKNKQTTFRTVTEKNYDLSTTPFVLKKKRSCQQDSVSTSGPQLHSGICLNFSQMWVFDSKYFYAFSFWNDQTWQSTKNNPNIHVYKSMEVQNCNKSFLTHRNRWGVLVLRLCILLWLITS